MNEAMVKKYIGGNQSHRSFCISLANVKAIAYILVQGDSKVLSEFLAIGESCKKASPDGQYAFGLGGRATSNSMQMAVHIRSNEIDLISAEAGGFSSQALGLIYRELYRAFETYLVDLYGEIALSDKRVLFTSQKISHEEVLKCTSIEELHLNVIDTKKLELTRVGFGGLEREFEKIGLDLVVESEFANVEVRESIHSRLRAAGAIRNILEHNSGVVNGEFKKLVPESKYKIGDRVIIDTPELGDAISSIEHTADCVNKRAVEKFALNSTS